MAETDGRGNMGALQTSAKRPRTHYRNTKASEEPWHIASERWNALGSNILASNSMFPAHFGESLRDFAAHGHHMKAAEWKNLGLLILPVFLKDSLPAEDYTEYINLVQAIQQCLAPEISAEGIAGVRTQFASFLTYYERGYYRQDYYRLAACLPVFHQLAHVADFLDILGPMWSYSQCCMERMCGQLIESAKNRSCANRNMETALLANEQRNIIRYIDFELQAETTGAAQDLPTGDVSNLEPRACETKATEDTSIYNFFIDLLEHKGRDLRDVPFANGIQLERPCYKARLNPYESRALTVFINSLGVSYGTDELQADCTKWKSCLFPACPKKAIEQCCVVSLDLARSNSTRCASMVSFQQDTTQGHQDKLFGMVRFFFTIIFQTRTYELAYVQQYKVIRSGCLVSRYTSGHSFRVIQARCIRELVGLIRHNSQEYFVTKGTPFFS
ncbi:hypothetical protein BZA77DRAFT_359987 [Pyronema omphalodes]|nr:hypothetical protein BZA77DRAFT_359987 [Pyronema omphalodes]